MLLFSITKIFFVTLDTIFFFFALFLPALLSRRTVGFFWGRAAGDPVNGHERERAHAAVSRSSRLRGDSVCSESTPRYLLQRLNLCATIYHQDLFLSLWTLLYIFFAPKSFFWSGTCRSTPSLGEGHRPDTPTFFI